MLRTSDPATHVEPTQPDKHLTRASSAPAPALLGVRRSRAYSVGHGISGFAADNAPVAVTNRRLPWQLLTADDMANLVSPEGQLDDNQINALFTMGAALSVSFVTVDSCLTSLQTPQKVAKITTNQQQQIWCGKSTENRKIMCPLHVESHWVLLVLELDTKCATLYNSLEDLQSPIPEQFLEHIQGLIQHKLPLHPDQDPKRWRIKRAFCPRQETSHDCGVYILVLMFYLLAEAPVPDRINAFIWRHILKYLCSSALSDSAYDKANSLLGRADLSPFEPTSSKAMISNTTNKPIDDLMAKMKILKKFYTRFEKNDKESDDLRQALSVFSLLRDRHDSLLSQTHTCGIQLEKTINDREKTHSSLQDLGTLGAWTEDERKLHETVMKGLRQSVKNNERWNHAIVDTRERLVSCDSEIKSVLVSMTRERKWLVQRMKDWGKESFDHFISCFY